MSFSYLMKHCFVLIISFLFSLDRTHVNSVFSWQSCMLARIPCIHSVLSADRRPTVKQILELPSVAKAARYDNVNFSRIIMYLQNGVQRFSLVVACI